MAVSKFSKCLSHLQCKHSRFKVWDPSKCSCILFFQKIPVPNFPPPPPPPPHTHKDLFLVCTPLQIQFKFISCNLPLGEGGNYDFLE